MANGQGRGPGKAPRGAQGKPPYPRLSEAELDELSKIGPEQIARAQRRWRRDAPDEFKGLLDATPDDASTS